MPSVCVSLCQAIQHIWIHLTTHSPPHTMRVSKCSHIHEIRVILSAMRVVFHVLARRG